MFGKGKFCELPELPMAKKAERSVSPVKRATLHVRMQTETGG
jgi:hypothetical protein